MRITIDVPDENVNVCDALNSCCGSIVDDQLKAARDETEREAKRVHESANVTLYKHETMARSGSSYRYTILIEFRGTALASHRCESTSLTAAMIEATSFLYQLRERK